MLRRLALAAALAALQPVTSPAEDCPHCHPAKAAGAAQAPASAAPAVSRSTAAYALPDVTLVDQDGRRVTLAEIVAPGRPVALNFIFTSCTTICPVMSSTFAAVRRQLGPEAEGLRMVSISIDPERDTPAVLRAYAGRFHAGAGWRFYTGTPEAVRQVLAAFEALTPAKTSHRPLTFLRAARGDGWVRLDGLAGAADIARELVALRTGA